MKLFEEAILKFDKNFSEVADEMGTKSTKQCIEFYYLWKKVMSDYTKKKWRALKKNRLAETNGIQHSLRSGIGEKSEFKDTTNDLKVETGKRQNKIKCPECNLVNFRIFI